MRYRTLLAYRFPPTPVTPGGHIEGFVGEADTIFGEPRQHATEIALTKVKRKLAMLANYHGIPMPFEPERVLSTRGGRKKITPAELKQLRADWKVSLTSNLV